jgi:flagellin
MGIVIRTNPVSMAVLRSLNKTHRALAEDMSHLASGQRIMSAKDDAAGLAISESLRSQVKSTQQASRNASDAISVLQIAEGGMSQMAGALTRMRELTMQAASGQISTQQRGFLDQEAGELAQEIFRISRVTEFNGQKLLDGSFSSATGTLSFQVGINNTVNDRLNVNIGTMDPGGLGFFATTISPTIDTQTRARNMLSTLDSAIGSVSAARANLGAKMNRLEITVDNLASSEENLAAANSRIRDLDIGAAMGRMVSNQILAQAGAAMLAQANALPQIALQLIG